MIRFEALSLRRGPRLLFSEANFTIHPGFRVGLTGANGTGKSSLFALIRNELQVDTGECRFPADWVIAHVAQETPSDPRPAIEYVLDGDTELRSIEAAIVHAEKVDDGQELAEAHSRYDSVGGYTARARAARLIHGLGFLPGGENSPVETYSGGWRMRLNLARALMCRSDLLLLDEPTNHLDLDAVLWLEDWLRSYQGTLLLISHDRDFLDSVVEHIAHIEHSKVTMVTGNYSAFERYRAEQLSQQQASYKRQQREIAHIQSFITRFKAKATKAKQAQSRVKALERMELIAPAHVDSPFHFAFRTPHKLPRPLLQLKKASAGYNNTPLLKNISLELAPGDRIGLLGPNGAGKSTLVKLLAGELEALGGTRTEAADLKIGYFAQHQLDQLHIDSSALEHMVRLDPKAREQELRDFLGGFGFAGERVNEPCKNFSGGEKARLVLALLVYQKPNLLLLDEPTNHLDLEMRHALAMALQDFTGAMVVVSHDRHLLRTTTDTLMLVHDGAIEEFKEDLDHYSKWLISKRSQQIADQQNTKAENPRNSSIARKEKKRLEAEKRKKLQPLKNRLSSLEKEMDRLSQRMKKLEDELADPAIYENQNQDKMKKLVSEKGGLDKALGQAEEEWLGLSEELENAD